MLKTTSTVAFALLLAASPSALLAQTTQQPTAPTMEQSTVQPTAPESEATTMTTPQRPVDGQIVLQDAGSKLAKDYIGAAVYAADGQAVGEVNDLIIDPNGAIQGVVIGVGGLLGIGEKQVALEMAKLTTTVMTDGEEGLVVNASKDELEAAPAFKTVDQQKAELEAAEAEEAMRLKQQESIVDDSVAPEAPTGTAPPE